MLCLLFQANYLLFQVHYLFKVHYLNSCGMNNSEY